MKFETIGNATIICYEKDEPILATDPWIVGSAYFGSWKLSHQIPPTQMESIKKAKYLWLSHEHPDHINTESLRGLKNKTVLLPDHVVIAGMIFVNGNQNRFDSLRTET